MATTSITKEFFVKDQKYNLHKKEKLYEDYVR